MNWASLDLSILVPAFLAGLLVTATHAPLGIQVLKRGIVFIDLAIAQIAGLGVMGADLLGWEPQGWPAQIGAMTAAVVGAAILTWTEKRWPDVQEATIGVSFVLAASAALLLLAGNPHGGEHLKDLLVGQILWVNLHTLLPAVLAYVVILALWFGFAERLGRTGFYLLFACAVTVSVQLVGVYLVFASLIIPALATRYFGARRLLAAYLVSALGYASGLALSALFDLPSGAVIVWSMAFIAIAVYAAHRRAQVPTNAHALPRAGG
jgi:zinc/manganese transport system permease protein